MESKLPRIAPLAPQELTDEQVAILGGRDNPMAALSLTRTLVQHPALLRTWGPFAGQMGLNSILPLRDREILILRLMELCQETYEAAHHVAIARRVGLTDAEARAARAGARDLPPFEQALAKAAEELVRGQCITDETWATLAQRYNTMQMMEVVFTVGMYLVSAMATKSFRVRTEDDIHDVWKPPIAGLD